ncbi:hypothetical protein FEM48_Zijuj09G0135500 [Ziziphus jujuba var. spinosa]|uniref:60S acidic ribosomal protein P2B-like n=1 Tax=Ziziphus jujuba var. spinosa TaxID=714518 RepID=A0A978UTA7_ZIZJJ|nr:hypothetical protein FEM48_Zijuj09G0135500 [Ziziphus jujuba var. spinosa]
MKVLAAYMLAVLGGNTNPTADDLKKILSSVGAEVDENKIVFLLSQVNGKDFTELIASGREKLVSMSSSFGGAAVAVAAAVGGENGAAAANEQEREEKVGEREESDDDDFNFTLFD